MTRIVFVANSIDEMGGAQRVVHHLAQELSLSGFEVDVIGIVPHGAGHQFIESPAYRQFTLGDRPSPARDDLQGTADLRAMCVKNLESALTDGPPGIIVAAQLWALEHVLEVPHSTWHVIGQYHSSFEAARSNGDLERAMAAAAQIDAFVLLTQADADRFTASGLNNTRAIGNAVPFFPKLPAALASQTITYLGRLSREKGPTFLLRAWEMIAPDFPQWKIQFVGDGPDGQSVREMAAALSSGADRVHFVDPVIDAESILLASSVVALPSLVEGFPLVLTEAMACGVPCVVSDCSDGVRALVEDGVTGVLVGRGDARWLADGLARVMADPHFAARLADAGRARAAKLLPGVVTAQWKQLFAEVAR